MSDLTRREVLTRLAAAVAAAATTDALLAREVHAFVGQSRSGGPYVPQALSNAQFRTLEVLTDLIIPVENGRPGALDAGVPAWIDQLLTASDTLKTRYTDGLAWLDGQLAAAGTGTFVSATTDQRRAVLDVIAFKKNASPDLDAGIEFFTLVRRMTVDGFYTSPVGIQEIIPQGRPPQPQFVVPQESIDYVISRSPFRS